MDESGRPYALIFGAFLCAPPIAILLFVHLRKSWKRAQSPIAATAIVVLLFILGMKILHVTFISALPGAASFAIAYFTYCFLVAACVQIPYRIIRYPMMIVVALPICAGYLLATISALGLMFILGDAFSQPTHVEKMGTNLVCEISMWGAAGSSSGYAVHLYELWPAFPFIEREVAALTVVQAGYVGDTAPEDKTCNDASKVYSR